MNRLVIVTGASSGIGAAIAREYAKRGWDVALTARRREKLEALADELKAQHGVKTVVIEADLAEPGGVQTVMDGLAKARRHADGLVNNAGYGLPGKYADTSWTQQDDFIRLMLTSYAELVHRVLPGMIERGYGRIVNVSSLSGLVPGSKGHTLYGAVKAALIKFSQSLHFETEGTGVNVTALCPGFTYSEFHDVNETRGMVSKLPKYQWMTAEQVAHAGYWAAENRVPVRVPGPWNKFVAGLFQILPAPMAMAYMRQVTGKIRSDKAQAAPATATTAAMAATATPAEMEPARAAQPKAAPKAKARTAAKAAPARKTGAASKTASTPKAKAAKAKPKAEAPAKRGAAGTSTTKRKRAAAPARPAAETPDAPETPGSGGPHG